MSDTAFESLQQWYADHLDGEWEHQNGVRIETLDNPGWSLSVDIGETELRERAFAPVVVERSEHDWIHARVGNGRFEAFGGPGSLLEMVAVFRDWAEGRGRLAAE
jgi:hypothetical protein